MAKVTLATIASLQDESTALAQLAQNFAQIAAQLETQLSRDGLNYDGSAVVDNALLSNFDVNNYRIINLPPPVSDTEPARHGDLNAYVLSAQAAQTAAEVAQAAAEAAEAAAIVAQTGAETAETNANTTYDTFRTYWLGEYAAEPTLDPSGNPLIAGALYYDTTLAAVRVFDVEEVYIGADQVLIGAADVQIKQFQNWPTTLFSNLTDTNFASLADGDFLEYSLGPNTWNNVRPVISKNDDVDTTGVADGDVLTYDLASGKWLPAAAAGGAAPAPTIRQHAAMVTNGGVPSVTLGSAPVVGNLLIALSFRWTTSGILNNGWTRLAGASSSGADIWEVAFKLVDPSDTSTIQPYTTSTGWSLAVFEIAGADLGTIAAVFGNDNLGSGTSQVVYPACSAPGIGIGMFETQQTSGATITVTGATTLDTAGTALTGSGSPRYLTSWSVDFAAAGGTTVTGTFAVASNHGGIFCTLRGI